MKFRCIASTRLLLGILLVASSLSLVRADSNTLSLDTITGESVGTTDWIDTQTATAEQRKLYQDAIKALKQGKKSQFKQLQSQLHDYVLAPYLEREYLMTNISLANRHAIQSFLDRYDNEPVSSRVRTEFLWLLARHNQTNLFLSYYRPQYSITLQCHWLKFRLKTDENRSDIYHQAEKIWLAGKSRPDACNPVFNHMKSDHALTEDLVWRRLILSVKSRKSSLVSYLTRLLPSSVQANGRYAHEMMRYPHRLMRKPPAGLEQQKVADVANAVLVKHIWRNSSETLKIIDKASKHFQFTYQQKRELARAVSLALASSNHPRASEWLNNIANDERDELLLRWKLAHELRNKNWQELKHFLSQTPAPDHAENDWNYWLARADLALGNETAGIERLEKLSEKRSYYGFLASAHLNKRPSLAKINFPFDQKLIDYLQTRPEALRAFELWKLNKNYSARREWNYFKARSNERERQHLAVVAHQWGWHEQVIYSLSELGLYDAVDMRFPIAFPNLMEKASKEANLDLSLSLAVARKESAFMPDARSSVGAVGLMQLMPYTAKYIAKKSNLPAPKSSRLRDPNTNLQLGTRYLKYLLDYHNGNRVLATASYNAGRHKVAKWLPDANELPADIWIEVVPYKETRSYIKNVLAYQQIYNSLLGNDDNYFEELVTMAIKK
ncbi:transglycosylase SLT domain-containing protein [Pleionea sediminis]|uniref:transglycosylase SLT domain-containing protein n=1 Tax=Pleionea sediminis TaxID=2569479 RepID=UPI001185189A|nr:transglycosylase SLT domain-containing protein [Pleionea sediminis]